MKKRMTTLLTMILMLCCIMAVAEDNGKLEIGTISINGAFTLKSAIPEGYTITPVYTGIEQVIAEISSEDPVKPMMMLSVAFDETYADVERMNDLSEEDLALLEKTYTDNDPDVEIFYSDTGLGTRLLIAKMTEGSQDYVSFLSVYKGYFVEFVLLPSLEAEDRNLTDEQLQMCIDYLTELDFIPAGTPVITSGMDLAGQTVLANLTGYDAVSRTVHADIRRTIYLDADTVKGLKVGDILSIGEEKYNIESLESDEYGFTINNEVNLFPEKDHYYASLYDMTLTESVAQLILEVPDSLIFMDEIDPETGEIQEDTAKRTAADFVSLISSGTYPDFASENVNITFGTDGLLEKVERFYAPWQ